MEVSGAEGRADRGRGCGGWPSPGGGAPMVMRVEGRMSDSICAAEVNTLAARVS